MNESKSIPVSSSASSGKMLQAMVGIGVLCALLIVLTYEGTFDRIEQNKAVALEQAIFKVLPGITQTEAYQFNENNAFSLLDSENTDREIIYAGFDSNDQLVGVAITTSGQGYADILRILYGYDIEKEAIIGIHVLESKETPGLGDKIEKDANFLENFKALDVSLNENKSELNNTVVTVKNGTKQNPWEVDGITGATISSRAIGDMLGLSTKRWVPLVFKNKDSFKIQKVEE